MKLAAFALACVASVSTFAAPLQLYVSPTGDDANPGSAGKPFATVTRARDEIRKQKPNGAVVKLAGGTYRLAEPFILEPQDSGAAAAMITYEAAPGATPVLSGGAAITGWKTNEKGWWQVELADVKD